MLSQTRHQRQVLRTTPTLGIPPHHQNRQAGQSVRTCYDSLTQPRCFHAVFTADSSLPGTAAQRTAPPFAVCSSLGVPHFIGDRAWALRRQTLRPAFLGRRPAERRYPRLCTGTFLASGFIMRGNEDPMLLLDDSNFATLGRFQHLLAWFLAELVGPGLSH
jgi:hypothetical protein